MNEDNEQESNPKTKNSKKTKMYSVKTNSNPSPEELWERIRNLIGEMARS